MHTILTLSGSLRAASSNLVLLDAMSRLAPADFLMKAYEGLGTLPHFNPDLDGEPVPETVREFRQRMREADAVILSSPEYAHGIPGALKNGLDWLVSTMDIQDKPLILINVATGGGEFSLSQLVEVLRTINARVLHAHSLQGIQVRRGISSEGVVTDPQLKELIESSYESLRVSLSY